MSEELIKKIDEITKLNQEYRRGINEKLNYIRGEITKNTKNTNEAYDRGLQDMWDVVSKVCGDIGNGGLTIDECRLIFGWSNMQGIVDHLSYLEFMDRYKKHMKARLGLVIKADIKAASKFNRGDVVMCHSIIYPPDSRLVVYIGETEHDYDVLYRDHNITQLVSKENHYLTKTGKHIDFDF